MPTVFLEKGKVISVLKERENLQEIEVKIRRKVEKAYNFPEITGPVKVGDKVLLNTTAIRLSLGTGGYHFVLANLSSPAFSSEKKGHIMKLRYTPFQFAVFSTEEESHPFREAVDSFKGLRSIPVVACILHSQIAGVAAGAKHQYPEARIAYIMTDSAALPLPISDLVWALKREGLIDFTITCGQAFGGDFEAVNIYSALAIAHKVANANIVIVAQGPGNVGTRTRLGFSGIDQVIALNATYTLKGIPVACPRISFSEERLRHFGLSHHSRTILGELSIVSSFVPIPLLPKDKMLLVKDYLTGSNILDKHRVVVEDGEPAISLLRQHEIYVKTMGRGIEEDREFFLAAGAAGIVAAKLLRGQNLTYWEDLNL
ncbi:DUF3866 family protein [bacterium]|nr:DUF3866 family protein [bacterium]